MLLSRFVRFLSESCRPQLLTRRQKRGRQHVEHLESRALLSAGELDASFGTGGIVQHSWGAFTDEAYTHAIQADGRIVVAGYTYNGSRRDMKVARFNVDGSVDSSFGSGDGAATVLTASSAATGIAIQSNQFIVVCGVLGDQVFVQRLDTDGNVDMTFGTNGIQTIAVGPYADSASTMLIQPDGNIVVGGWYYSTTSSNMDSYLLRLTSAGTLDTSFGSGGIFRYSETSNYEEVRSIALQPDGSVVFAGTEFNGNEYDGFLRRVDASGTLDSSFSPPLLASDKNDRFEKVLVQPDGKIVATGWQSKNGTSNVVVVRVTSAGVYDTDFSGSGIQTLNYGGSFDYGLSAALRDDGKLVVAGSGKLSGNPTLALARLNPDGNIDTSFGIGGIATAPYSANGDLFYSVALQNDGKIVAVGDTGSDIVLARFEGTSAPTAIQLSKSWVLEQQPVGTVVGTLLSVDPDLLDTHTYAFVSGTGDTGNAAFTISGNQLLTNAVFDYSAAQSYSIRVRSTDQRGQSFEQSLTIDIDTPPTVVSTSFSTTGYLPVGTTQLTVTFSEPVTGANLRDNYELRAAGTDGLLLNSDSAISPTSVTVNGNVATLYFNALTADTYRLTVRDAIVDQHGNPLDGNDDGQIGGSDKNDIAIVAESMRLDPTFGDGGMTTTELWNGSITSETGDCAAIQWDGKIIVAGADAIVRYNPDGSLDNTFGYLGKVRLYGAAHSLAIDNTGRIVVAMMGYGVNFKFKLARYNPNGTLDKSFHGDGQVTTAFGSSNDIANSVVIDSSGRIVVAGYTFNGSNADFALARYNADGTLDTSFDSDGMLTTDFGSDDGATSVVIDSAGRIVVAGYASIGGNADFALARYEADGSLDTNFDSDGMLTTDFGSHDRASSVVISNAGKIAVVGYAYNGSNSDFALAQYNADGSLDTSLDGDGKLTTDFEASDDDAQFVAVDTAGRILVGGFRYQNRHYEVAIARYNADGSFDTNFHADGKLTAYFGEIDDYIGHLSVDNAGRLIVVGSDRIEFAYGQTWDIRVARYDADGALDSSFDGDGVLTTNLGLSLDRANGVATDNEGRMVVVGVADAYLGGPSKRDWVVTRYNSDGSLDASFDGDGKLITHFGTTDNSAEAVAIDSLGRIVVAGYSNGNFALARYKVDGSLDLSFDNDGLVTSELGFYARAFSIAIDSIGRIVVAGVSYIGAGYDFAIARYNVDGTLDTSFDSDGRLTTDFGTSDDFASGVTIDNTGRVVVVGNSLNGRDYDVALARYNVDGSLDTTFDVDGKLIVDSGSNDNGDCVDVDSQDRILVAGSIGGHFSVMRLNVDGTLDSTLEGDGMLTGGRGSALALTIDNAGRIVVAGIELVESDWLYTLGRYNPDGSVDTSLDGDGRLTVDFGVSSASASALVIDNAGQIVTAGVASGDFAVTRSSNERLASLKFAGGTSVSVVNGDTSAGILVAVSTGAFDGLNRLLVGGALVSPSGQGSVVDYKQTVVTNATSLQGLDVHREITVPNSGSVDFVRTLDVFANPSAAPITTSVRYTGNLGSDAATTVFMTSDGDTIVEPADQWFGTDDGDGTGTPAVIHFLHGPGGLQPSSVNVIEDNVEWTYDLTVPAGQTSRLATFTILGTTRADAIAAANALVTPTGFAGQAAAFLDNAELASIVNFVFNSAPIDLTVSSTTIAENSGANALVGLLSTTDPDSADTFTYSLVSGTGSDDNAAFRINGNRLEAISSFNFETRSSYSIRLRTTDAGGLSFEKAFTVTVTDVNEAPTAISLSNASVKENLPAGTTVGSLSATDPDAGESFTYSLVAGTGSTDNASFTISGTSLKTAATFNFEAKSTYSIRVRAVDHGGLSVEQTFTISIENVTELGGIDVQLGQTQRSYVRYLDVLFDRPDDIMSMVNAGRFQLTKNDLNGVTPQNVPLSTSMFTRVGNSARIDFGSNGLGGNRNSTAGDGYYQLGIDMDGDGTYESVRSFYRLLGDVNGDRKVDTVDSSLVLGAYGTTNPERDVNGDGTVNANDRTLLLRSVGRKLKDDLFADD